MPRARSTPQHLQAHRELAQRRGAEHRDCAPGTNAALRSLRRASSERGTSDAQPSEGVKEYSLVTASFPALTCRGGLLRLRLLLRVVAPRGLSWALIGASSPAAIRGCSRRSLK